MIQAFLPEASSYAGHMDGLFTLIFVLVGFWFVVSEAVFFWLLWKFRAREGHRGEYITGELKSEKRWITIPHLLVLVCDVFIIVGAVRVWYDVKQNLPPAQATIRVIGQQWAWTFVHPGPDGKLGTADDITKVNELHVTVNTLYHFELESLDVIHDFSVPVFRLKQDAIPGRVITGWFQPTKTGEYDIQCAKLCGLGHGLMGARLYIESPEQHAAWLAHNGTVSVAANAATSQVAANAAASQE